MPETRQNGTSLPHALNRDCLEQLYARCSAADVLSIRQTCRINSRLLNDSVFVWASLLARDYGLVVKVTLARVCSSCHTASDSQCVLHCPPLPTVLPAPGSLCT